MRGRLLTAALAMLLACGGSCAAMAADSAPAPAAPKAAPAPATAPSTPATPAATAPAAPAAPAAKPAAPATSDAQFFAELGYKDVATAADAARAFAIFKSEGKETGADFEAARTYLAANGVADEWLAKAAADTPLDKGHLASLACKALGLKGGLWMQILGPLPRLALQECGYLGLMVGGCDYCHVTGGELVGVIDRADRLRIERAGAAPAKLQEKPSAAAEVKK